MFLSEEPGSSVVRKLIDGIKAKKDTHDLLGILYEIPASDKSSYAADEAIGTKYIVFFLFNILGVWVDLLDFGIGRGH